MSPSDCNTCFCVDDGVCTELGWCTEEKVCPTEQRNPGEFCDLNLNNCVDGFTCQKAKDFCGGKSYGRCVKIAVNKGQ